VTSTPNPNPNPNALVDGQRVATAEDMESTSTEENDDE
jgi:hypothetical protein